MFSGHPLSAPLESSNSSEQTQQEIALFTRGVYQFAMFHLFTNLNKNLSATLTSCCGQNFHVKIYLQHYFHVADRIIMFKSICNTNFMLQMKLSCFQDTHPPYPWNHQRVKNILSKKLLSTLLQEVCIYMQCFPFFPNLNKNLSATLTSCCRQNFHI